MHPCRPRRLSVKVHGNNEKQHNLVIKIKNSGIRLAGFPEPWLTNCVTLGKLLNFCVSLFLNLRCEKIITSTSEVCSEYKVS